MSRLLKLSHICLIRPVTAPKLLLRLHLSLLLFLTPSPSPLNPLLHFTPPSPFLLSLPLHLLPPLWSFALLFSLYLSTHHSCVRTTHVSFLSSSPRDKERRWHDGFQSGQEQFAPGLQRFSIVLDKQVRWSWRVRRENSWQEAIRGAKAWPPRDKCISFLRVATGWGWGE